MRYFIWASLILIIITTVVLQDIDACQKKPKPKEKHLIFFIPNSWSGGSSYNNCNEVKVEID